MAVYRCRFCGSIYDEEKEGVSVSDLRVCPICIVTADKLMRAEGGTGGGKTPDGEKKEPVKKQEIRKTCKDCGDSTEEAEFYDPEYARTQAGAHYMDKIHEMAVKGQPIIAVMGTQMSMSGWDDILFLGAQLNPMPLDEHALVKTEAIIGKYAVKPTALNHPVYISHMPSGALSGGTRTALSRRSAVVRTAMCSGEGDILPEEKATAYKYIFEYIPSQCSVTGENLREVGVTEIKIRQGTKPGMGGHLPESKVTLEIAAIRNKPLGQDIVSPSHLPDIDTKEDLKDLVDRLYLVSDRRPTGAKIVTGRIEKGLEFCVYAGPDFVVIDGRGGVTGASPKIIRDSTGMPTIYVPYRARKYLDQTGYGARLVVTGSLQVSFNFAKALAMGVDAVAIISTALMAVTRQQHRICDTGMCPAGVVTRDEKPRSHPKKDVVIQRVVNFLRVSLEEIKTFARTMEHNNTHNIGVDDSCTAGREISEFTSICRA